MNAQPQPSGAIADSRMRIVIIGLSITSSWGNGHATTYRGLVRELSLRGHDVLFLEWDAPWYAPHRDLPQPPDGRFSLYRDLADLETRFAQEVQEADLVIVGSYVREGVAVGDWVQQQAQGLRAFYDIDTPVTLARLARSAPQADAYLEARQIAGYDLYLSFTGGPVLRTLERNYGSPAARVLYCSVDPALYFPSQDAVLDLDLGYMGTYSDDRQPTLDALLLEPARRHASGRFCVAGPQYPARIEWPSNVERIEHLPPAMHRAFYNRQRFTLNVTRADMIAAGWSPSVRLFEAAACGTAIVSDRWDGLETLLVPGREILLAETPEQVLSALRDMSEAECRAMGEAARQRILSAHTAAHRAAELEAYALSLGARSRGALVDAG